MGFLKVSFLTEISTSLYEIDFLYFKNRTIYLFELRNFNAFAIFNDSIFADEDIHYYSYKFDDSAGTSVLVTIYAITKMKCNNLTLKEHLLKTMKI